MPWREVSVMNERREFVRLAMQEGVNRRELCRRFGISPEIGYKWLGRFAAGDDKGDAGFAICPAGSIDTAFLRFTVFRSTILP